MLLLCMVHAGLARLCSVKTLDYQEHASEYGVHWNFFLTVAAVATVTALVPIPKSFSLPAGAQIAKVLRCESIIAMTLLGIAPQ